MHRRNALSRSTHTSDVIFVVSQVVLFVLFALAYFAIRGLTESGQAQAFRNAERLIEFEQSVGIYWEEQLQSLIIDHDLLVDMANWAYIWFHWPAITIAGIYLAATSRHRYAVIRNAIFISGAIGLIIFATFPVAPPRLAVDGLVDTITARSNSYRVLQPPSLTNQYAALPSLHFGWNLLIGIGLFWSSKHLLVRIVAVFLPSAVFVAVILTANHYIIDPIVGGALALFGLAVAVSGPGLLTRIFPGLVHQRAQAAQEVAASSHREDSRSANHGRLMRWLIWAGISRPVILGAWPARLRWSCSPLPRGSFFSVLSSAVPPQSKHSPTMGSFLPAPPGSISRRSPRWAS